MSLGNVWGLQMLRKCTHPVGVTTRGPRRADRDTHLGCQEDPPSESQGDQAPHTWLQQEHLHSWIRLRDPQAGQMLPQTPWSSRLRDPSVGQRYHPRYPNPADTPFISPVFTQGLSGPQDSFPPSAPVGTFSSHLALNTAQPQFCLISQERL